MSLVVGGLQEKLIGMSIAESVIDDVVHCLQLFVRDEQEALSERIPSEDYLANFKALAKAIAPDGEEIQTVGFTAVREGQEKTVALRAVRRPATTRAPGTESDVGRLKTETTVTGTLLFADALEHKHNLIKLVDEAGVKHSIVVPPGMMDDIVRPLWDSHVTVTGPQRGRRILLTDILKTRE